MQATIFHNPRCSKSRAALALLEERGIDVRIVAYLDTPPNKQQLQALLAKLELPAAALLRTSEPEFKASGVDLGAPQDELLELMLRHPRLIERPIVVVGSRARIGRPPERILEILE
jgi:arsenate reductase (glutaredoxin)